MIRRIGSAKLLTYSQTLNGLEILDAYLDKYLWIIWSSGPILVSRTGAVGWTKS